MADQPERQTEPKGPQRPPGGDKAAGAAERIRRGEPGTFTTEQRSGQTVRK